MMIPITRKEKYINEIVGGGDTAPKTPQTREEFFFAAILGEVIAPSPVTRTEKYLSAIVGQYSGDLPTPITRIEYFLAKAAGMEIETPIPITREEMLWDTYIPIKTIEGIPPLTFKAKKAGTLKDYRIYGNTVDGESVGDRTANLWDETIIQGGTNNTGTIADGNPKRLRSDYIFVEPGETYSFASNLKIRLIYSYDDNNQKVSLIRDAPIGDISYTFTVPNAATKIIITVMKRINNVEYDITPDDFEWGQLEKGSVVTSYEPYGYRVPVTVTNGTDTQTTNLYLLEQIKMVGDEAEYISYADQKLHRVGADDIDVTLPELPVLPGTNTLTVGTEVQPSNVYIKYEGAQ